MGLMSFSSKRRNQDQNHLRTPAGEISEWVLRIYIIY